MKSKKAITLVSLIITVVLLIIVTGTTVGVSVNRFKTNNLKRMYNDIELLNDKVENYYIKYGGLPILEKYTSGLDFEKNTNDNENYYIIDLSAMENISLNYGKKGYEHPNESDDVYIINEKTHIIYYVKGIEDSTGTKYHSLDLEGIENNNSIGPTKPEIKILSKNDENIEIEIIPGKDNISGIQKTEYNIKSTDIENNITQTEDIEISESTVVGNLSVDKAHEITAKTTSNNGTTSENTLKINELIEKLNIGDFIAYDHTKDKSGNAVSKQTYTSYSVDSASQDKNEGRTSGNTDDQVFNVNDYSDGWRLCGIKNGKMLIVPSTVIRCSDNELYYLRGKDGLRYAVDELNEISKLYAQGYGAIEGRSVNVDDINSITGYNPLKTGTNLPFSSGNADEYGVDVSFYWQGTKYPYFETTNSLNGSLAPSYQYTGFNFYNYDTDNFISIPMSKTATVENKEKIITKRNTTYKYFPTTLTESSTGEIKGISSSNRYYNLYFNTGGYWLASKCEHFYVGTGVLSIGIRYLANTYVYRSMLYQSNNYDSRQKWAVKPMITLDENIKITKDDTHDGTTKEKACLIIK